MGYDRDRGEHFLGWVWDLGAGYKVLWESEGVEKGAGIAVGHIAGGAWVVVRPTAPE